MKNVKLIKDIPVGILVIVLSQFVFYGVVYLTNFPKWYELIAIVFLTLISSDMVTYGVKLIKGYEFDKSE
jgi:ABC-type multidrug transport system permease subunit